METVSDLAIAFHYTDPSRMYMYEYFIYHLKNYGTTCQAAPPLPRKIKYKEMISKLKRSDKTRNTDEPKYFGDVLKPFLFNK